jgi:hypothetical protein
MNETLRYYKTLRSYTQHFFEMRATIANITYEDVIRCFQNGLFSKHMYHDLGRNRPSTTVELRDMMAWWADKEDSENDRFPKCNRDKQGNNNSHFDKQGKLDQEVAAVERNPRGKKSGNNDTLFEKVLYKQCPMHSKSRHTLFECVSLRKSHNAPLLP